MKMAFDGRWLRGSGVRLVAYSTAGIFILALLYTLRLADEFLMPLAVSALTALVLLPVVRTGERFHIPTIVSSNVVVFGLVGVVGFGAFWLAQPAADWIERAPQIMNQAEAKLHEIKKPLQVIERVAEEVEKATNVGKAPAPTLNVAGRSVFERAFGGVVHGLTQCAVVVILLIFLLAFGDKFKEKLVKVMPTLTEKKRAVQIWREIEHDMSRYLFTVTIINFGYGAIVGFGLYLVGLPNPALWGVMAAVLNYIPYFGPVVGMAVLFVVGIVTFDTVEMAIVPPSILGSINFVEGSFVTPSVLGRRFEMNPVVIFMAVAFWGWIWGVPGALMAVPILVSFKVVCDHVEGLQNLGEFLGR